MAQTLLDKIWDKHVVATDASGRDLLYVDRHLMHEVTSPQAFDGLRQAKRDVRRRDYILAVADHNVATEHRRTGKGTQANSMRKIQSGDASANQMLALSQNCNSNNIRYFPPESRHAGIVHVVGPEQGFVLPGMTVVCGDSHTSTNGALGCLAFGIGTTEVEHVMATQTIWQQKPKVMRISIEGKLPRRIYPKDVILHVIGAIRSHGATGHSIEYAGAVIENMGMDGRFTVCNMSIEAGARSGMVAVDETTIEFLRNRPLAPKGKMFARAAKQWRELASDAGAKFDSQIKFAAAKIKPQVTWGTTPDQSTDVLGSVPDPACEDNAAKRDSYRQALAYMGLEPGKPITEIEMDRVFIGSCTNARLQDIEDVVSFVRDAGTSVTRAKGPGGNQFRAIVVPGSKQVSEQAIAKGYARELERAGFEWRLPGCSMCLGMNDDVVMPEERCASTSNRNFEGRQGYRARTHLVSPVMAAAVATIGKGRFVDVSSA